MVDINPDNAPRVIAEAVSQAGGVTVAQELIGSRATDSSGSEVIAHTLGVAPVELRVYFAWNGVSAATGTGTCVVIGGTSFFHASVGMEDFSSAGDAIVRQSHFMFARDQATNTGIHAAVTAVTSTNFTMLWTFENAALVGDTITWTMVISA